MAMVVFNTTNLALLQELSWVPCSGEIHQEQIYRIRDWWGDVIQPVGKRQQNNTTDTPSRCGRFHQVAGVQCWQPYNTFMAKSQTQHLKQRKEEITDTVYHSLGLCSKLSLCVAGWNPGISLDQCTMHTVVIYFKKYGVLHHISLCIISDDLEQDTCFVHELQRIVMLYIRENWPQIKFVDNFSDSCAMHSKKYKAFLNLCHHKWDFDVDETSHGKSPCNGIGGTVKHKILHASLQRPVNNQFLTFGAVKQYCKSSIEGITPLMIDKEYMVAAREILEPQYELGDIVPGTRSCHHFLLISQYTIEGKQLSINTTVFITHFFLDIPAPQNETFESLKCIDLITCCFDGFKIIMKIQTPTISVKWKNIFPQWREEEQTWNYFERTRV